jgi:hypothetical protein
MVARMSGLSERVLGGRGRMPRICSVRDFGTEMGSIPNRGLHQSGPGYARRPLPWCGVAVEDLRQEGAGTVFCVILHAQGVRLGQGGQH